MTHSRKHPLLPLLCALLPLLGPGCASTQSQSKALPQSPEAPQELTRQWGKYKQWIQRNVPVYHQRLSGPATREAIAKLEAELGLQLPEDFKQLYLENNGEDSSDFIGGSMLGHRFLSLEEISKHWQEYTRAQGENWPTDRLVSGFQPDTVKNMYFHPRWVPLFTDTQGDFLGYDFSPEKNGRPGQIINFGSRERVHYVIAEDLTSFLKLINEELERKNSAKAVFTGHDGTRLIFGFEGEGHLTDDLTRLVQERGP